MHRGCRYWLYWPYWLCTAPQGMQYLHGHKPLIIHRDLKSPNLLLDKHWRVKVRASSAVLLHLQQCVAELLL